MLWSGFMEVQIPLLDSQRRLIWNQDRILAITGSAGSGKSQFGATKTILYALDNPHSTCLVVRKTFTSLRKTSILLIRKLLADYGLEHTENKSEHFIELFNGARIDFVGMDDLRRIRSIDSAFIFIEQAEELTYPDFMELNMRLRGPGKYQQIVLVFTPEENLWIYKLFEEDHTLDPDDIIRFCYKDNLFLPPNFITELEKLKELDPDSYRKYALGLPGRLKNIIYEWPTGKAPTEEGYLFGGIDWGYNNPNAFALMKLIGDTVYILDEVYMHQATKEEFLAEVLKLFKEYGLEPFNFDVWYDPSEPGSAEVFKQDGFNMLPGYKKPLERINRVKTHKIIYDSVCVNVAKELKAYKWMMNKDGDILDKPLKFYDHLMNAIEYAVYGMSELMKDNLVDDPYSVFVGQT